MRLQFKTEVQSGLETVRQGFNERLFVRLKPPFIKLTLDRFDGCEVGDEVHLRVGLPGIRQVWVSRITEHRLQEDSWCFVDEGVKLPFPLKRWQHQHEVKQLPAGRSEIRDEIFYSCDNWILDRILYLPLWLSFAGRASIYRSVFTA